ncbi:hypothetical protein CC86DRAFT_407876 [Ophiobolus disseminans]|uniref:Uncharacterized protein n=1 Tax=Ophiobolus disseminans TaxID=1469910 RepID=A0A6A6ZVF5_9PLEO|nr:hypothetical protein CC86DRAFT_407876 [Ophiobolus disseminans]
MKTPTTFLKGWNTLPDELKLQILKYLVNHVKYNPCPLNMFSFIIFEAFFHAAFWDVKGWTDSIDPTKRRLETLGLISLSTKEEGTAEEHRFRTVALLSIPVVKDIAREALYSINPCRVEASNKLETMKWPPVELRRCIQHLHLRFTELQPFIIEVLFGIASGKFGVENLNRLELAIEHGVYEQSTLEALQAIDVIELPARILKVYYSRSGGFELEEPLLSKLTIHGNKEDLLERWDRGYHTMAWDSVRKVEAWPDVEDMDTSVRQRRTVKMIWMRGTRWTVMKDKNCSPCKEIFQI